MPIDLTDFSKFMNQFLPILLRQKFEKQRVERWLAKSLAEYEAWGSQQKALQETGLSKEITAMLVRSGLKGTEEFGRPVIEALSRLGEAGVTAPGLPTISPEKHAATMDPYAALGPALGRRLKVGEYPSEEEMTSMTRMLGTDWMQKYMEQTEKTISEREARRLRGEQIELGWAEVGVKKKGKPKKQLEDQLKFFAKKEKVFVDELESLEEEIGILEDEPKVENLKTQIAEMRQNQLNTLDQLLGELDKKKCDKIIAKLRTGKATVRGLEKNKEQFMKKENLTEAEYHYIRLSL